MGKRIDPKERVIDYFMTAPVVECEAVLSTVKVLLKHRSGAQGKRKPPAKKGEPVSETDAAK